MAAASMQPIYDRLNAVAGYNPLTAETFGDWAMEAGDIVRVIRGEDAYDVPVHSSTLIWRGQQRMNIDATGKKERDSIAKASAQKYGRGGAAVRGSQSMYQYFESENQSLRSEFEMSYESLRVTFENELDSTRSEFQMTAESLRIQFENEIASTRSEFEMTSESLRIEFENEIASTRSEFNMTAESLRIQFENELSSTRSEFEATSESLRITFESEISSTRSDIQVQANRIGLVVSGTGSNARIKAAEIAVAINDDNSEAFINADHVYISGTTKLSGQLTVQDGSLLVKTALLVSGSTGGNVTINNGKITAKEYQVNSGGEIVFVGAGTGEHYDLSASTLQGMIKSFSVTGNVLTLTPFYGDPVDFSKAVSLSGTWSGGVLTVSASPSGVGEPWVRSLHQTETSWNGYDAIIPVNVFRTSGASEYDEGTIINVSASVPSDKRYTTGWSEAYEKVVIPGTNTSTNSATFKTPNATASSNPVQNSHVLSMGNDGNNAVVLYRATDSGSAVTIAKFTHNKYDSGKTQGWSDAYAKVAIPGSNTSTNSATFKTPNSAATSNPAQNSHALSMGNDGNNAVVLYRATDSGNAVTIAKFTHNKYDSGKTQGWTDAYNKVSIPGSNTSTNSATFKTPNSAATSNPVQNSHVLSMGNDGNNAVVLYRATDSGNAVTIAKFTHDKYTSGQNAVTLNDASWNSISTLTSSRTVTVSTSGRPTQLSKSKTVYLTAGTWSNGSMPTYIRDGSTSGTIIAQSSVSAPSATMDVGSWSSGSITVTAKNGTASMGSATVTLPDISAFDTTAPNGESITVGTTTYTNNSSGYDLNGSGSSATCIMVVKSTWTQGGKSMSGKSYLQSAPTALYRKGYSDGYSVTKSQITGSRGNKQTSQPTYDTKISDISGSSGVGWYVITVTVHGTSKTFGLHIT